MSKPTAWNGNTAVPLSAELWHVIGSDFGSRFAPTLFLSQCATALVLQSRNQRSADHDQGTELSETRKQAPRFGNTKTAVSFHFSRGVIATARRVFFVWDVSRVQFVAWQGKHSCHVVCSLCKSTRHCHTSGYRDLVVGTECVLEKVWGAQLEGDPQRPDETLPAIS